MQVHAYIRVSTEEQAEEGFSLPTQRQRITDFCRSQWGAQAEITWYEDEGFSAKNTDRPGLRALRRELRAGDVAVVLRIDRLTRSVLDLYTLLKEWDDQSVFFRSVTEPYDTQKPEGRFMIGLLALLAEWERLRISERVREVMANTVKEQRRHLSKAPFAYRLAGGTLEVEPREAALVREVFALYLSGHGTRTIARKLNGQGWRTRQGALWTDFAISYILRNPVYAGKVAWQRISKGGKRGNRRSGTEEAIVVQGSHPPLIAQETWAAAQATLACRHRTPPRAVTARHLLTGVARCGLCGSPVHGVVQRRYAGGRALFGRERLYYRCSQRDRGGCRLPYLPGPDLERRLVDALDSLAPAETLSQVVTALYPEVLTPRDQDRKALETELKKLQRARRRWDEAYANEDIDRREWQERIAPLQARRVAVEAELGALDLPMGAVPEPKEVCEALGQFALVWAELTPAERKLVLQSLLTRIEVGADGSLHLVCR